MAVVTESSASPDWWNLKFNDDHFWEKPPLYYWLGIMLKWLVGFFGLSGIVTLPVLLRAFSVVLGLLLVFTLARYVEKRKGRAAGYMIWLLFLGSPGLWLFSPSGIFATHHLRSADSDILQLLLITLGVIIGQNLLQKYAALPQQPDRIVPFRENVLVAILSGLAVLTKGPWGLLPSVVLWVELLLPTLREFKLPSLRIVRAAALHIGVGLLVVIPWHAFMYAQFGGEFLYEYLIYHQLLRASTSLEGHGHSFTYYWKYFLDIRSFWILWLALANALIIVRLKKYSLWSFLGKHKYFMIGLIILVMLSLTKTKLAWYSLYTLPFLFIFAAESTITIFKSLTARKLKWQRYLYVGVVFIFISGGLINVTAKLIRYQSEFTASEISATDIALTEKDPHRVIYYFSREKNLKIMNCAQISKLEGEVTAVIFDRNEYTTENIHACVKPRAQVDDTNYKVENLSDNYGKLIYR